MLNLSLPLPFLSSLSLSLSRGKERCSTISEFRVELVDDPLIRARGSSGTGTFEIGRLFDGRFQPRSLICRVIKKKKRGRERERKGRKGRGKEGRKELACHWASLLNWVNEAMDPKRWVEPLVRRSRTGPENSLGKVSIHHAVIHAPCFLLFALSSWFNFSPSFVVLYACVYVDRDRSVHYGSRIDECVSNRFSC